MQIWNYDPATGELLGAGVADPNPMEPGEWLVPAHATPIAPGEPQVGHVYRFAGSAWESVPDHRGEIWWKAGAEFNTEPVVIAAIGDPTEHGLTNVEPPAPPAPLPPPLVVSPRQIRQALNLEGWRAEVETWMLAAGHDTQDNWLYAPEFVRGANPVEIAAEELGKTPAEIDELFELAKSL